MSKPRHTKILGYVDEVEGDQWWAVLKPENSPELYAEMALPLPDGMGPGNIFTIHRTKRGRTYLYWVLRPAFTRSQIKRARTEARRLWKVLVWEGGDND